MMPATLIWAASDKGFSRRHTGDVASARRTPPVLCSSSFAASPLRPLLLQVRRIPPFAFRNGAPGQRWLAVTTHPLTLEGAYSEPGSSVGHGAGR